MYRNVIARVVVCMSISLHLLVKLPTTLAAADRETCSNGLNIANLGAACFDRTSGDLSIEIYKENYRNESSAIQFEGICPLKDSDCQSLNGWSRLWNHSLTSSDITNNERGDYAIEFKNIPDGRYYYGGVYGQFRLCLHRSNRVDVREWNATLDLQYDVDNRRMTLKMGTLNNMEFGFTRYLVALKKQIGGSEYFSEEQSTVMEGAGACGFGDVWKSGTYRAEVTPIDCRCRDDWDSTARPCAIHSNTAIVRDDKSNIEAFAETGVSVENVLWYTAAAGFCLVLACVVAYLIAKARRTRSAIKSSSADTTDTVVTFSDLDDVSITQGSGHAAIPVLFLYSRSDPRLRQKASELRLTLQSALPSCTVYDYGDEAQEDELYQEGPHWFAARLHLKGTRVIVIISEGMQQLENALLNSVGRSLEPGELDLLCFSGLSQVTGLVETHRNTYSRVFCVKFTGIDDHADCKSLTPLRRFELPQHTNELIKFLQIQDD